MGALDTPMRLAPLDEATEEPPPPLYASRVRVYPQAVRGPVRRAKWAVLILCLAIYYLAPWLRWNRGPGVPDQAVLVDMEHGRLFFLWLELWPQEVYYLTGLLVLGAVAIFAATSMFGRVWCGFTCPQTVWTDLFMLVERWIEGDRNARMRRDRKPLWGWPDRGRKLAKHAAWLLIAAATGGAWVMYFNDAPTLARAALRGEVSPAVAGFFGLFTATTYLLAGWAREQVCTYMCPWPRFQAAMLDADSLVVSYRDWRGEPRGKAKGKSAGGLSDSDLRASPSGHRHAGLSDSGLRASPSGHRHAGLSDSDLQASPSGHRTAIGDCVDCRACVHVCPTGVDIRDGQQLGCIGCGLCIDACDAIMAKLDRATGLIGFETLGNLAAAAAATASLPAGGAARCGPGMAARRVPRLLRPRTLIYAASMAVVAGAMLVGLALRQPVALEVLRDRAPLFVRLSDGGVRNGYTLKVAERRRAAASLAVVVEGLPAGARLQLQGAEDDPAGRPNLVTRPDDVAEWRLMVTAPAGAVPAAESTPITIRLLDPGAGDRVVAAGRSVFLGPKR